MRKFLTISIALTFMPSRVPMAVASQQCATTCERRLATCKEAACAHLHGKARRACTEGCRGRAGCPAAIRTLAYVVTECREVAQRIVVRQALRIRRGDCEPVTVMEFAVPEPVPDPF